MDTTAAYREQIFKYVTPYEPRPLFKIPIHDHGYIALVQTYGSDESIVEAARMSVDKGFLGWGPWDCPDCGGDPSVTMGCAKCKDTGKVAGDEGLLHYLYTHRHDTPFEMAGMIIEVQAPIFVFREWHRHRTQSYNEMSARYIPLPDYNYMPTIHRLMTKNTANKQANAVKGAPELTEENAAKWLNMLKHSYEVSESVYQQGLEWGVPKELARCPVPVARYSRMRANANLRNWLAFMTLRSTIKGPNAQQEIRDNADVLGTIIEVAFPRTMNLFVNGKR
jgi:thymidylate synthase (FAD)